MKKIVIKGAKEHNLKNISLEIPKDKFVVITGLSGSGKSSLAFDTVYAEGQLTTRKWKDEQSGQDKYSTEIVIQGYNSSLTMLGGGNSGGGIANDNTQSTSNNDDMSQISNDMDDEIPF